MPWLQSNRHSLHFVSRSVSHNSKSSTVPMPLIIFLDFNWMGSLFCCRSAWRSCRWRWFSIFTISRTAEFSACFTTKCGIPDILNSMSTSLIVEDEPTGCPHTTVLAVLSWFRFGFGWVGWEPSACRATSEPISLFQSCFKEIFGGGRDDAYTFSYMICPSFHPNNFQDTISWECFVKNDGVRSRLIELQSFLQSKIDVDPIYCVLMSFPCFMQVLCTTRYTQVDRIRIFVFFVHRFHRQKECLFVAQILSFRYQSWIDDGM